MNNNTQEMMCLVLIYVTVSVDGILRALLAGPVCWVALRAAIQHTIVQDSGSAMYIHRTQLAEKGL